MARPCLLKVRLYYEVEGTPVPLEIELDACKVTALFFDDHAAVEILGGFYDGQKKTITKDEAIARFGTRAEAWFPAGKSSLPLNKAFIAKAWGGAGRAKTSKALKSKSIEVDPRANPDTQPFMLIKDPSCMPSGYP
jgi:hypothetical protein